MRVSAPRVVVAPRGSPPAAWLPATAAAIAALTVAFVVPLASVAVVWPLLFVVPGFAIVARVAPRVALPGRIGLGVVVSVALSTHLVFWLGQLIGYRRETIFMAAAILAVTAALAVPHGDRYGVATGLRPAWTRARAAFRRHRVPFLLAAASAAWVAVTLALGIWRVTVAGVTSGGSNWSDLLVHVSIAESLNAGNFPPDVPYFAGVPLNYHWFSDFHAAIAARAAGLFSVPVMVVSNAIFAGALALLVHALGLRLLRRRRAAAIATVLVVFGGGMGYVRFFGDLSASVGDPVDLVTRFGYDNIWLTGWPYFRIPSVMGTGLLAHRATTIGLPMLVGVVLLVATALPDARLRVRGWRDRPAVLILAGFVTSFLAPFHFFFFPAALLVVFLYVLIAGRLTDAAAPANAARFLAPCLLAVPFVIAPLATAAGAGSLRFRFWWDAPVEDGPLGVAFFYATNLGVPFLLAIAALLSRRTPSRAFLLAWASALFVIPNVAAFSSVTFDMNKYFQAMWVAVGLLAAWLLRRWHPIPLAAALGASVLSPVLVSAHYALDRPQILTAADLDAAAWARAATPERSVFVTDGWLNSFTDIAGRLRVLTYTPYVANLGYDPALRSLQVRDVYCGGAETAAEIVRTLDADYVVDGSRPVDCEQPTDFEAHPTFELVYRNDQYRIWQVVDRAPRAGWSPSPSV